MLIVAWGGPVHVHLFRCLGQLPPSVDGDSARHIVGLTVGTREAQFCHIASNFPETTARACSSGSPWGGSASWLYSGFVHSTERAKDTSARANSP